MIARDVEQTIAEWLTTESDADGGGIYRLATQSGAGVALPIRTGHSSESKGDIGEVIVEALQDQTQQEVPGLNLYSVPVKIRLVYPCDDTSGDTTTISSFDACLIELQAAIDSEDLTDQLNDRGHGALFHGFKAGATFTTSIDNRVREAEWLLTFAVSQQQRTN